MFILVSSNYFMLANPKNNLGILQVKLWQKKITKQARERKIGKQVLKKNRLSIQNIKNTIWTVITSLILLVFFIINNTRTEPEEGPYRQIILRFTSQTNINY